MTKRRRGRLAPDQPQVGDTVVPEPRELPMDLLGADETPLTYADTVHVGYSRDDISISFFQYTRPILKTKEEVEALESLPARCVARLVLPARAAIILHGFLGMNLQAFANVGQAEVKRSETQ